MSNNNGAWRRHFQTVADLSDEAPEAVRDLARFVAAWETDDGLEIDGPGFRYFLQEMTPRELASAHGAFLAHRRHFAQEGCVAVAALMDELAGMVADEAGSRGITGETLV